MAGHYSDAENYVISSWFLGCMEKEIHDHVLADRERIINLLLKSAKGLEAMIEAVENSDEGQIAIIDLIRGKN